MGLVIAIDGPSGSGKSSVSRAVAAALGAAYLDTGAMYRALTWSCLHDRIALSDRDSVAEHARRYDLRIATDPARPTVSVGRHDVTQQIREDRITEGVSAVATNLAVRAELQRRQRELIAAGVREKGAVVAEGRDITTVVAPDADVRILLTASESARLARRAKERTGSDDSAAREGQRDKIVARDAADSTVSQFVTAADGVTTLDTSEMTFEESVAAVLQIVEQARRG